MVANSATQKRYKITTNASTLGELKKCLADNGIRYANMSFTEGITKTTLIDDNALLPTNIPFKGGVTNNLVLLLTNTRKNIASGMGRQELYASIKSHNLAEEVKSVFGKNFTQVSSENLAQFLAERVATAVDKIKKPVIEAAVADITECVQIPVSLLRHWRNQLCHIIEGIDELLATRPVEITEDDLDDILSGFEA